jgi:hypothetical protein
VRKFKPPIILITLVLILLLSSCNMPRELSPEQQTAIAETVGAGHQDPTQTEDPNAQIPSDTPDPGAPASDTPEPSDTPELDTPTPSDTPIPCNQAEFVKDVNVPDGKVFDPGEDFTKTWRLKNTGSCSWTSGYDIVFDGGDSMDGPSSVQLTSGTVDPGETVDVSVDLTAPDDPGTYKGNWKLRDSSDVIFGIDTLAGIFWVKIKVVKPEETVKITWSSRGQVYSDGSVGNPNNAGDSSVDTGLQGFITYDLSSLPNDAEITEFKLKYSSYDVLGDPFVELGCLRVYVDDYGALGPGDYTPPPVSNHINKFCSEADLSNASVQFFNMAGVEAINDALPTDEFQIRLQFNELETNGDGIADAVRGKFDLVITYR